MKIVIDIPEEDYLNLIKTDENGEKEIPLGLLMSLWDCVKYNCTPLPKNHGRLIDADELKKHKYHDSNNFENAVSVAQIDWADTIIEAESEDKNEDCN